MSYVQVQPVEGDDDGIVEIPLEDVSAHFRCGRRFLFVAGASWQRKQEA